MKMSDLFNLPVYDQDGSVMCQGAIKHSQPHSDVCIKAIGYKGNADKLAKYNSHAINNHDRLEQENAELREALQETVELSERFVVGALTLAKHDYPLSPSSGIQLKDWKKHEEKLKQLLNK